MTSLRSSAASASGAIHPAILGFGTTKRVALDDAIDVRSTTYLCRVLSQRSETNPDPTGNTDCIFCLQSNEKCVRMLI